jgi:isocitrate/isopropylmalate dehydrogenase
MDIVVMPGDGIGPEITTATLKVLQAANEAFGLGIRYETQEIGLGTLKTQGTTLPPGVMDRVRGADGAILGPVSHFDYPSRAEGGINQSAEFRIGLDLYANIRPCRSRPGLSLSRTPMDLIIVRENTEGFYSDRNMHAGTGEFMPTPDMAMSVRKITAQACSRVARTAFELARGRRKKVTAVHKANVLKLSDGLFLREVRKVAEEFPDIALEELIVDATAAILVRDAQRFDVMVTTNMFGDILSDEASELSGSLGLGGGLNAGAEYAVAQAQHGSAPDIAGRDRANPVSLILSSAMLLDWLAARGRNNALSNAAEAINRAVDQALANAAHRTPDIGGPLGTAAFGDIVAQAVRKGAA